VIVRCFLHHGRRLRRQARDSRALLRTARDEFDLLGARPWAEMARAELRAAGETSGLPRRSMSAQLSAQELQIATPVHLAPHRQRPPAPHPRHHRRGRPVFLMSATVAGGVS
jgi:hypothetical protein